MLPEYGRHIHEMVDYLFTIDSREERNRQAKAVIGVMGNLFPLLRDTVDYTHKLWDHMFIMADFRLDVDSPYPIPTAQQLAPHPEKMRYPTRRITIKHYGKNLENILHALRRLDNKAAVEAEVTNVARFMRGKGVEFNEEHPNNESIVRDIRRMAGGDIAIDEAAIANIRGEYQPARSKNNGHGENWRAAKKHKNFQRRDKQ